MAYSIRSAEVEDADAIARVHVTSWRETYRGLMPDDVLDSLSIERRSEQWKNTLADPTDAYHHMFVAEAKRGIVGFANFGKERENDEIYRGELFAIYILREFQGRGLGRDLVEEVANGLLELGVLSMLVWVLSDNPARKFYERLGGVYLREKTITIGNVNLPETAYGWSKLPPLAGLDDWD